MQERRLDNDNDIYMDESTGCIARADTPFHSVSQAVKTRLQTFRGECFTDNSWGVPWFGDVLGADALSFDYVQNELKEIIRNVEGVAAVDTVNVILDASRNVSIEYRAKLEDGGTITGRV